MKPCIKPFVLPMLYAWTVLALEVELNQSDEKRQRCSGMYSRTSWGGPVDPFILVKFTDVGTQGQADPTVSLVIFEWRDEELIGILPPAPDASQKIGICEQEWVDKGYCNETHLGEFILAPNATEESGSFIFTKAVHLNDNSPIKYPIKKTGYFCVLSEAYSAKEYQAAVEFRNAYGELPATQIPKLPFYGGITILYALVLVFWGLLYLQHRADILPVQNYIAAILVFLLVEMLMTWGFYDYLNRSGSNIGSKVLLVTVAVLNAARNSFSFFLLLIVCMGYGVVKHTLGGTMIYVRWLAMVHFIFGLVYAIASLLITPDTAGPLVLLIVLPLAGSLTAFYVWTLNSLNFTLKDLRERKQNVKEAMYKKLWWCILISVLVIFVFFFLNSFSFASASDPDFVPFHWKSRWFILDGWLNLVYFADVAWIAYVWRPTANNRRFAMSDEIAQDDDGNFEFGNMDIEAPEEDDGEEAQVGGQKTAGSAANGHGNGGTTSGPRRLDRDSMDGETIFAVGEHGDKLSDDEASDEEERLVREGDRR